MTEVFRSLLLCVALAGVGRGFQHALSSAMLGNSSLLFRPFLFAERNVSLEGASFAVVPTLFGGIFGKAGCGLMAQRLGFRASLILIQLATALGIGLLLVVTVAVAFWMMSEGLRHPPA